MSIDIAAAQPRPVAAMPYVHHGAVGEVFLIFFRNLALNVLTFGFYRFWARTRLRHYFWSQSEMFGDRFEYDGRGLELFLGFLFIAFIVLLPIGVVGVWGAIGAIPALAIYLMAILVLLGERNWLWLLGLPAALSVSVVYLFKSLLYVRLPDGWLLFGG